MKIENAIIEADPDMGITAFCNSGLKGRYYPLEDLEDPEYPVSSREYPDDPSEYPDDYLYNDGELSSKSVAFDRYIAADGACTEEEKKRAWYDFAAGWRACLEKVRSQLYALED